MSRALRRRTPQLYLPSTFRAFRNGTFRFLWPANFLSYASRWMQLTLLIWLVLELTDSPWLVALVGFFNWGPMIVLGLIGGLLADSVSPRKLLATTQTLVLLSTLAMTALLHTDLTVYWHAYIVVSATGIGWALDMPSRRSVILDLMGSEGVTNAIALDSVGMFGSRMVGPALAGLLISLGGVKGGYVVLTALQIVSLLLLWAARVPQTRRSEFQPGKIAQNLKEGLGYVRGHRTILATVMVTFLMNLLLFPYVQMVPIIARDVLHVGPGLMGLLQAADGMGALVGAILIASAPNLRHHGRVFLGGSMLGLLALLAFSFSQQYGLSFLALLVLGLGMAGFGTMQSTIVLLMAGEEIRGRALGVISLAIGSSPLGALMIGAIASAASPIFATKIHAIMGLISLSAVAILMPSLWWQATAKVHDRSSALERMPSPQAID